MRTKPEVSDDGTTVTVRVPISIRRRGGRKLVLAPDGVAFTGPPIRRRIDSTMVKAIARAFRWRDMIENGTYATIREIAAAEKISETYVGRTLRLTLLAPSLVESVLEGRQANLKLDDLMTSLPIDWMAQSSALHYRPDVVRFANR
ncbi:hypothetical protein [Pseudorhodoplanes sp.]|uniref:hypothetical protein n=1 Tax=Pseudorhodoplanes sp. TaxID=1934341 RepID=UPI0039197364